MTLLSTYGAMKEAKDGETKRTFKGANRVKEIFFKYPIPFNNHFKYCQLVDSHISKRHFPILVEQTLGSKRWAVRQVCFLLAVTEVNVKLAMYRISSDD